MNYVAADDSRAAEKVGSELDEAAARLGLHSTGRPGRVSGTYEKSVIGLPYILQYSLPAQSGREYVLILNVVHTAQNWPKDTWPRT